MADEWWNSSRTVGDDTSACSTAPATESAASGTSMNFQPGLPDAASASSSSFLADPHVDWTQAFMGGKAAAGEATSFNALLQLQGHAGQHFLLDGDAPLVPVPYTDGTAVAASSQGVPLYADNQYSGSASSYAFSQLLKNSAPSAQHQHQQFPGFFSSSGLFGPAPEPPQLLLQALEPKPVKDLKVQSNTEHVQDACSSVTRRSVPDSPAAVLKKPRIATPSPLPTFKVRKEKLGDRITALQQLVSPFGKTDTASVLHEAIEYIKFLHDQVASLSSPYLRCGRPVQVQYQQGSHKAKDGGQVKQDLRSRGLCLVPVGSTYTVASETAPEFWHPTFGGTFR